MRETRIGKIRSVRYGFGGYQDAMYGISFDLGGKGWGVGDFWGTWAQEPDEYTKWTKKDQDKVFLSTSKRILELLKNAEVQSLEELVNTPIEIEFEGNTLKSWRVLTEAV